MSQRQSPQSRPESFDPELEDLSGLAVATAHRAGDLLAALGNSIQSRRELGDHANKKSSETDLVTEADRKAEQLIVESLLQARPNDAILGEESGEHRGTSGLTWIIDPLDGTTNFVYGFGSWAVSIAASFGDQVVVGVVYDPTRNETFRAALGRGAMLNDKALVLEEKHTTLSHALLGTGFSYAPERRAAQAKLLAGVLPFVRDIRRAGAAALDLCFVGAGRLDAYFEASLMPWDKAAGELIANEAGAKSIELDGLFDVPTLVVARGELFEQLQDLLQKAKPAT